MHVVINSHNTALARGLKADKHILFKKVQRKMGLFSFTIIFAFKYCRAVFKCLEKKIWFVTKYTNKIQELEISSQK